VVALALRLRAAGHDVLVATGRRWQPALAAEGLAGRVLPLLAADPRDVDFGFRLWGRGAQMAVPLAAALRGWGPDAVVADTLTVCGAFAAGLLDVPWAELLPHPLQDVPAAGPPQGLGLTPGRGPLGRARDAGLRALTRRGTAAAAAQRRAALVGLGLDPGLRATIRLVATLPALEQQSRPDAVVVGPLEWEPPGPALAPPAGDSPLVLLSPTTASGAPPDGLVDAAVRGLSGCDVRLVATVPPTDAAGSAARSAAGSAAGAAASHVPAWAVVGSGRQAPLLDLASVVVCGGGGGILGKALRRGLPLVVIPGHGDQRENADRVRRLGAGVVIGATAVSASSLGAAVRGVLASPAYASAARAAATHGRAEDPVAVLEAVLR